MATAPQAVTIPVGTTYPVNYNHVFVKCPESHMILVVRGGGLHKIIHEIDGWDHDDDFRFFNGTYLDENLRPRTLSLITGVARELGYHFVGIPPFQGIYQYPHEWIKFGRINPDSPEMGLIPHRKELIFITPWEYQYGMEFKDMEVGGEKVKVGKEKKARLLSISFELSVRTRMVNPKQALMTNKDWFAVLTAFMQTLLKNFVGTKSYGELITKAKAKDKLSEEFFKYVQENDQRIIDTVGVHVYEALILSVTPDKEYQKAIDQVAIEEEKARQLIVATDAQVTSKQKLADVGFYERQKEAEGIEAIAAADKRRIEQTTLVIAGAPGVTAAQVEKWRQIHGSGLATYVEAGAGAGVVITPSPGQPVPQSRPPQRQQGGPPANPPASQPAPPANPPVNP